MSAQRYIRELYEASGKLSDKAIREAIDELSKKRIAEIRSTPTNVKITGKSYYVSNDGDDENDGLSPTSAWKTLDRVSEAPELQEGDGVFFRRGDLWRGKFLPVSGVTYSAFGEGEKPRLYGSMRNAANADFWKETDTPNVWEYAFTCELDIGNIVFDEKEYARKVYRTAPHADGKSYDYRRNVPFSDYHDLVEDMTFFHDYTESGKLYLRCERGNPGTLSDSLEIAHKITIIQVKGCKNVTIDNLCLAHTNFGISSYTSHGLTVQNCEIKWAGGCIQQDIKPPEKMSPTAYGNGIEIYGGAYDFTVSGNYIWQVYDAGATHQCGRGANGASFKNVKYIDNVIEKCVYGIEIFLGDSTDENYVRSNEDTYIENNILRCGGGFGHEQRVDYWSTALIRYGRLVKDTKNNVIRNNILDRSETQLILNVISIPDDGASMVQYIDNIYVQTRDKYFAMRCGKAYVTDENTKSELEALGTEYGAKIIITDDEDF